MGLVGQDGGEADAAVIVDGDVQIFVSRAARLLRSIAMDAMAWLDDPGELFDIEVDEIAWTLVLVAHHRRRRIKRTQPVHAGPAQDATDSGPAQSQRLRDPPAVVAQPAKSQNLFYESRRGGTGRSVRTRSSIAQPGTSQLTVAAHPFGRRPGADVEAGRGQLQRQALFHHSSGKLLSTMNRQSGILVIVHSIPPKKLIRRRTSFSQSDRMDNLLKLHI